MKVSLDTKLSIFPGFQQVIGVVGVFCNLVKTVHCAAKCYFAEKAYTSYQAETSLAEREIKLKQSARRELEKERNQLNRCVEKIFINMIRIIPVVGTVYSSIEWCKAVQSEKRVKPIEGTQLGVVAVRVEGAREGAYALPPSPMVRSAGEPQSDPIANLQRQPARSILKTTKVLSAKEIQAGDSEGDLNPIVLKHEWRLKIKGLCEKIQFDIMKEVLEKVQAEKDNRMQSLKANDPQKEAQIAEINVLMASFKKQLIDKALAWTPKESEYLNQLETVFNKHLDTILGEIEKGQAGEANIETIFNAFCDRILKDSEVAESGDQKLHSEDPSNNQHSIKVIIADKALEDEEIKSRFCLLVHQAQERLKNKQAIDKTKDGTPSSVIFSKAVGSPSEGSAQHPSANMSRFKFTVAATK